MWRPCLHVCAYTHIYMFKYVDMFLPSQELISFNRSLALNSYCNRLQTVILSLRKHEASKLPAVILLSGAIPSCKLISTIPMQNNHEFRKIVFAFVFPAFVLTAFASSRHYQKLSSSPAPITPLSALS